MDIHELEANLDKIFTEEMLNKKEILVSDELFKSTNTIVIENYMGYEEKTRSKKEIKI